MKQKHGVKQRDQIRFLGELNIRKHDDAETNGPKFTP